MSLSNVAVTKFGLGVQIRSHYAYIINFYNLHVENCLTNVLYGDSLTETTIAVDAGEGINYHGCIFGSADVGHKWTIDGFDVNFYGCSLDFCQTGFLLMRGWKRIAWIGGHIEGNPVIYNYQSSHPTDNNPGGNPLVVINAANIVYTKDVDKYMFDGNYPTNIDLSNNRWAIVKSSENVYYANSETISVTINGAYGHTGQFPALLSANNNPVYSANWDDYDNSFKTTVQTGALVKVVSGSQVVSNKFPKALQFDFPDDTVNNYLNVKSPMIPCGKSKTLYVNLPVYETVKFGSLFNVRVEFFSGDRKVGADRYPSYIDASSRNSDWKFRIGKLNIPAGIDHITLTITAGMAPKGAMCQIGEFAVNLI